MALSASGEVRGRELSRTRSPFRIRPWRVCLLLSCPIICALLPATRWGGLLCAKADSLPDSGFTVDADPAWTAEKKYHMHPQFLPSFSSGPSLDDASYALSTEGSHPQREDASLHVTDGHREAPPLSSRLSEAADESVAVATLEELPGRDPKEEEEAGREKHHEMTESEGENSLHERRRAAGMRRRRLDGLVPGFFKRRRIHQALPVFPENKFPEVASHKIKASFFSAGDTQLDFIQKPSAALLKFLGLERADVPYGIVVKMKPHDAFDMYDVVGEGYLHRMFDDQQKFPWVLPLLGVYRGQERRAVYLFFPLYRTLPGAVAKYAKTLDFRLLLAELLTAVADLHERHLIHRDLKDDNFLVDPEGHVVVADLETVAVSGEKGYLVGTGGFMPPETQSSFLVRDGWLRVVYNDYTDIYSLGVTFQELKRDVERHSKKPVPMRALLMKLISKMKRANPKQRPDVHQIMEDDYFEGINFHLLRNKRLSPVFPPLPGADALALRRKQKLAKNKNEDEGKKKKKGGKKNKKKSGGRQVKKDNEVVGASPEKGDAENNKEASRTMEENKEGSRREENKEGSSREENKEGRRKEEENEEGSRKEEENKEAKQSPVTEEETAPRKPEVEQKNRDEASEESAGDKQERVEDELEKDEGLFDDVSVEDNEDGEASQEEQKKTQAQDVNSPQEEEVPIGDEESQSREEDLLGVDNDTTTTATAGRESIFGDEEDIPLEEDEQGS